MKTLKIKANSKVVGKPTLHHQTPKTKNQPPKTKKSAIFIEQLQYI